MATLIWAKVASVEFLRVKSLLNSEIKYSAKITTAKATTAMNRDDAKSEMDEPPSRDGARIFLGFTYQYCWRTYHLAVLGSIIHGMRLDPRNIPGSSRGHDDEA